MAYVNCQWNLNAFKDLCQNVFGDNLNISEISRALNVAEGSCRSILSGK